MAKYQFELTDTYGGEANYSWVKRTTVELPDGVGDKWLLLMAREWAGFSGVRCAVEDYGDQQTIRPRGLCQVLFVTYVEPEEPPTEALRELVRWGENTGIEKNPALAGIDLQPLERARKALL